MNTVLTLLLYSKRDNRYYFCVVTTFYRWSSVHTKLKEAATRKLWVCVKTPPFLQRTVHGCTGTPEVQTLFPLFQAPTAVLRNANAHKTFPTQRPVNSLRPVRGSLAGWGITASKNPPAGIFPRFFLLASIVTETISLDVPSTTDLIILT